MHKPSFSVMGKKDMFSKLQTFLVQLSGSMDEKKTQSTQYLREICWFSETNLVRVGNEAPVFILRH